MRHLLPLCLLLTSCAVFSGEREADRMDWWREARFGLFLHWGLYALPAGEWNGATGYGEWIQHSAHIPVETYEEFVAKFDPVDFDADEWVRIAKEAGMRYIVITTKHHDGFCLFDSEDSYYDIRSTPFARDVMAELAEACRRQDMRIGWYHSIMDWHHPDYLPRRSWEDRPADTADFERYVAYLHGQVEELLTDYGEIGVMWFDGEWEETWTHEHGRALYELCRELQPDVIVNNRVDKGRGGMAGMTAAGDYVGDFGTPEQEIPPTGLPGVDWETCLTMNDNWGYNRADHAWKSAHDLIRTLVDVASKGGNLLLNVGPTARGTFPAPALERLNEIGTWMDAHGEAIYGTVASPLESVPWGRCTLRPGDGTSLLYLCVFDWPSNGKLELLGLGNEPVGARLLSAGGRAVNAFRVDGGIRIDVPPTMPNPHVAVIALEVLGAPIAYRAPRIVAAADVVLDELEVRIESQSPELVVRYTTDGSEPVATSPRYLGPILIVDSVTFKTRAFHEGRPVTPVVERTFREVEPLPALAPSSTTPGLTRFSLPGDWNALPDIDELIRFRRVPRDIVETIAMTPEIARERLVVRHEGLLRVPERGLYTFHLTSDDGSRLWIEGQLVVDNDGLHGAVTKTGTIALAPGLHSIRVDWFNKTGSAELSLRWAPLGGKPVLLGSGLYSH